MMPQETFLCTLRQRWEKSLFFSAFILFRRVDKNMLQKRSILAFTLRPNFSDAKIQTRLNTTQLNVDMSNFNYTYYRLVNVNLTVSSKSAA